MDNQIPIPPNPPSQQTNLQSNYIYKAGIVKRYLALFIDELIFIPINLALFFFTALLFSRGSSSLMQALAPFFLTIISSLVRIIYNVFFILRNGATPGKKLLKVKVISETSQPLTVGQVVIRETVGKFLSGTLLNLGYLWAIWDKNRQTWHDKLGKTYVVTTVPNNGKNPWWYYLILILPIISILAIMAAVVVLAINPLDVQRRARDSVRKADLTALDASVNIAKSQDPSISLCGQKPAPCSDKSISADPNFRNIDGTGWVKVDISKVDQTPKTVFLPVDPTNNSNNHYTYCSDGENWEINARLESEKSRKDMIGDGGDDPQLFEIGSNLTLCERVINTTL